MQTYWLNLKPQPVNLLSGTTVMVSVITPLEYPELHIEIGLIKKDGKYQLQTDFWDDKISEVIGENGGLLKQRYAVEQTRTQAIRNGYRVIERQIDNTVRLHVRM